jgi:xanthine permease
MKQTGSIYELDGRPALKEAIPLGLQHVLAMFVGNLTPIILLANALELSSGDRIFLIQSAMLIAGIATLIQLYPIGRMGARLPVVMGTSSGFIATSIAIGKNYGMAGVMGACLVGGLLEGVLGFFIKPLKKFFPPLVTGLVVLIIGLALIPVGVRSFGGGNITAADFGSMQNLLLGTIVLVTIVVLKQFTKGFTSLSAILIGITVGYLIAIPMGKVDFTDVRNAAWFSVPTPFRFGMTFHWDAILAMAAMYVVTAIETVGDVSAIAMGGMKREATDKELSGGVIADGIGSAIASVFGVLPNTSFSQNVGLIGITKVINRFAIATGAIFLVLAGLIPKLGAIISIMPPSVLGGAAIIMFAMIAISGINLIVQEPLDGRNGFILAVALGVGYGLSSVTGILQHLPTWLQSLYSGYGIAISSAVAVLLNIVIPKTEKEETTAAETTAA